MLLLSPFQCFAWHTIRDSIHSFSVSLPCNEPPIINSTLIKGKTLTVYNCWDNTDNSDVLHYIHIASNTDKRPIRYRQEDTSIALENDVIGFLLPFGGNRQNISFSKEAHFHGYPSINYHCSSLRNAKGSTGVSALIKGRHIRIGSVYDTSLEGQAKRTLDRILNSFSVK